MNCQGPASVFWRKTILSKCLICDAKDIYGLGTLRRFFGNQLQIDSNQFWMYHGKRGKKYERNQLSHYG